MTEIPGVRGRLPARRVCPLARALGQRDGFLGAREHEPPQSTTARTAHAVGVGPAPGATRWRANGYLDSTDTSDTKFRLTLHSPYTLLNRTSVLSVRGVHADRLPLVGTFWWYLGATQPDRAPHDQSVSSG